MAKRFRDRFGGTGIGKETDSKVADNFRNGIYGAANKDSIDSKKVPSMRSTKECISYNIGSRIWADFGQCP